MCVACAFALAALALPARHAAAETWRIEPSISADTTLTDNVDLTPSASRRSDLVTVITPALTVNERGAHSWVAGTIQLPLVLYARTGSSDRVAPEVDLNGNAELYPRLLYIDGSVQISQQYASPFGARPQNIVNATDNRYTAQSYRISPYVKGEAASDLSYELRDNNTWTNAIGASTTTNAYTNELIGNLQRAPIPFGWGLEFNRTDTQFTGQNEQVTQISRARGVWRADPTVELSVVLGYEDNHYLVSDFSGATYGAGIKWHPTDRTNAEARWEYRFFGGSYYVSFDHRTPLTVWSLLASRDISTYPQQLASFTAGGNVNALLNSLFASRVADPVARQDAVNQFILDRGLPATLTGPLTLFTQQVTLVESVQGTVGLIGARNSIFLRAYRSRSEPIEGADAFLIGVLSSQIDNTQTGTDAVWTYQLTPFYTLTTTAAWTRTIANDGSNERSTQSTLQSVVSAQLTSLTSVFGGARYQHITSNFQDVVHEAAIFAGIRHRFR